MLILMWVAGPEVAENDLRLYLSVGTPVGACGPGNKAGRVRQTRPSMTAPSQLYHYREKTMWTKPEFTEMRFGFEVTMYIANR